MATKKIGDHITCEINKEAGVVCVTVQSEQRAIRFIFEDDFSYMVAAMVDGDVKKADSVVIDDVLDAMIPAAIDAKGTNDEEPR